MHESIPINRQQPAGAESGQAAVLIALLLVGLIAMAGLAVDGGGWLFLARDAQNAADSTAIAAAFAVCSGGNDPIQTGLDTAEDNRFRDGDGTVVVEVLIDPTDENGNLIHTRSTPDSKVVQVTIEVDKPSYFIGVAYGGDLEVNAVAVVECVIPSPDPNPNPTGGESGYAMRSLSGPGECSSGNPSVSLRGSGYRIEGNIYAGSIDGSPETSSPNVNNPRLKIFGDVFVGAPMNSPLNTEINGDPDRYLNELEAEVEGGPGGNPGPGPYDATFGAADGTDPGLPYTMDDYRPNNVSPNTGPIHGTDYCSAPGACGSVQNEIGTAYYDISYMCAAENKIIDTYLINSTHPQVNGGAPLWNNATNTIASGIYYANCPIEFGNSPWSVEPGGGVTFVTEGQFGPNAQAYNFQAYQFGGTTHPVAMSWYPGGPGGVSNRSSNCSGGSHAIRLNNNNAVWVGDLVAWNGHVDLDGNDNNYEVCMIAWGFRVEGGEGTRIACQEVASAEPVTESPSVRTR